MAKIGNEARLILKLAKERSTRTKYRHTDKAHEHYVSGYLKCFEDIWLILDEIVLEMEMK